MQDRELVLPLEQPLQCGELEQEDADREDVAAAIDALGTALLGRHVRGLALEHAGLRDVRARGRLRDAEVDDLHLATLTHQHVRGRHVAMHDAERPPAAVGLLVRVMERGTEAVGDREHERQRDRLALRDRTAQDRAQVLAVHVLHREERLVAVEPDVEHARDVRVVQRRSEVRLVAEHPHELRILGELGQDPLDHDDLGGLPRTREEQLRHAPHGQAPEDVVAGAEVAAAVLDGRGLGLAIHVGRC